jgi:L-alanine-DL-glutamate epimerase-like enolase superfamily enzyme
MRSSRRTSSEPPYRMIYDQIVIERIEARAVGPDVDRYSWASDLDQQYGTLTIVRAFDDEGCEGVGATPSYSTGRFDLSILETLRHLAPRVIGADPLQRESVWYRLEDLALPPLPGARSALDIALWDIAAQRAGMPIHQLLGGSRTRLPVYASTPLLVDAAAYVEFVGDLRERGFRAVKFHAWCEPDRDLDMLRKVHDAHGGSGMAMMHDAEQRYDRHSALRVAQELDAMGFRWLEAPLPDHDLEGYADLRRRVAVPIIAGGNDIVDIRAVGDALRRHPWDALRFDVTVAGGFTPSRKLVALAEGAGLWAELQSWGYALIQAANLHLGLGVASTGMFELPVPAEPHEYGVQNPYGISEDGHVEAPTAAGLGIVVDWERMDAATFASFAC